MGIRVGVIGAGIMSIMWRVVGGRHPGEIRCNRMARCLRLSIEPEILVKEAAMGNTGRAGDCARHRMGDHRIDRKRGGFAPHDRREYRGKEHPARGRAPFRQGSASGRRMPGRPDPVAGGEGVVRR